MPPSDTPFAPASERAWLVALVVAISLAFFFVVLPFYGAVMWAAILALLFAPLQRGLARKLEGREGWAAFITLMAVILIVILPLMAITVSLAREGTGLAQRVQSGEIDVSAYLRRVFSVLPAPVLDLLERFGITDAASIQQRAVDSAGRLGQFLAGQVLDIGQNTLDFLISLFVSIYIAFFLLKDGHVLMRRIGALVPLRAGDKRALGERLATVVRATVKGNLVVALVQGTLGGLALGFLGITGALLWGAVMAALSLLPAVGAALVWGPIALYLLATGFVWQGVALVLFGVFVIGLVDNLLRPMLVGRDTQLPDWLVLVSTIGGIAFVGINGFVLGPVAASMFITVWQLYGRRAEAGPTVADSPDASS